MNRNLLSLLLAGATGICTPATAQHTAAGKPAVKSAAVQDKGTILPYVYLGNTSYKSGPIKKDEFDALLKQGLTAHDSLGNKYKVTGFNFSYGEKTLYEDSIGNNIVMTDYLTEYCPGNTVTQGIATTLYTRTKAGDSVYFDGIRVLKYVGNTDKTLPDFNTTLGVGMKFAITR